MSYNVFFNVFSNPTRLKIIDCLREKDRSVGDICKEIGEEQSKVSHNLNILQRCHFVNMRKDGKKRIYSLNKDTIKPLIDIAKKHVQMYCTGECWVRKDETNLR
jgi:ArsR family transcriptional regulator